MSGISATRAPQSGATSTPLHAISRFKMSFTMGARSSNSSADGRSRRSGLGRHWHGEVLAIPVRIHVAARDTPHDRAVGRIEPEFAGVEAHGGGGESA